MMRFARALNIFSTNDVVKNAGLVLTDNKDCKRKKLNDLSHWCNQAREFIEEIRKNNDTNQ